MKTKILTIGLTCLLMLGPLLSAEKGDPINNYWQKLFSDRIETVYIIMKDYAIFPHTNHYEDIVYMDIGRLEKALKKKGYAIKDIAIVIHNHLDDSRFSILDRKQYRRLKKYGFKGHFLLYSHITNKAYDIEDKKKSK